jgi:hypothetical protein
MAMRTGREGGTMMAQAAAMEGGSEYQVVMVLDHPAVGTAGRKGLISFSCLPNTDLSSTFYR